MESVRSYFSTGISLPRMSGGSAPALVVSGPARCLLRITACRLAKSPKATLYIRGSGHFVTSVAAPIASGWSEPVPGRDFQPAVDRRLSRRTDKAGPMSHADECKPRCLLQNEAQNVPLVRAQSHANADFMRLLCNGISKHSVNANRSQEQCHAREYAQQESVKFRASERRAHDLRHGANARDREITVEGMNLCDHGGSQRRRVGLRPQGKVHRMPIPKRILFEERPGDLVIGPIDVRNQRLIQRPLAHVSDNADNGFPGPIHAPSDAFPDGILAGPEFLRSG